jgi:hypothetical protein
MTYTTCPRCGIRIGARNGIGPTHCPRCLARSGATVDLISAPTARRDLTDHTALLRPGA